jgi:site-specific recombinase XerD
MPHPQQPKLLDQVRAAIRVRHYSIRTEHAYVDWIKRFIYFHGKRHPKDMGAPEINAFLSHLASDLNVAASTQNQALSAILFLYRAVLGTEPGEIGEVVRAKKPVRVPVVLSVEEVGAVLSHLKGTKRLMALLLYGTGMRIVELIRLRVKDVDFAQRCIVVRDDKGQKDRIVPLPAAEAQATQGLAAAARSEGGVDGMVRLRGLLDLLLRAIAPLAAVRRIWS